MPYSKNNIRSIKVVGDILSMHNEVFLEHYIDRSVAAYYFIVSVDQFNELLQNLTKHDYLTVYKNKQLPFRLSVDLNFPQKVVAEFDKKKCDYIFYGYEIYPNELESYGCGSSLSDLKQNLIEIVSDFGKENLTLCFGEDPRPIISSLGINENENILVISGGEELGNGNGTVPKE